MRTIQRCTFLASVLVFQNIIYIYKNSVKGMMIYLDCQLVGIENCPMWLCRHFLWRTFMVEMPAWTFCNAEPGGKPDLHTQERRTACPDTGFFAHFFPLEMELYGAFTLSWWDEMPEMMSQRNLLFQLFRSGICSHQWKNLTALGHWHQNCGPLLWGKKRMNLNHCQM